MTTITIQQLEQVINDERIAHPSVGFVLAPTVRELSRVYARVITDRLSVIDLAELPESTREIIVRGLADG